jgi:antirestriction protein ArdC
MSTVSYDIITEQLLDAMQGGIIPWRKTWSGNALCNAFNKTPYKGINTLILGMAPFGDHRWATWNQIASNGGNVKQGEEKKYTRIVLWNFSKKVDSKGNEKSIPFLKYYRVYNVEQCENLNLPEIVTDANRDTIAEAEEIVNGYKSCPCVQSAQNAWYNPVKDIIGIPDIIHFDTSDAYYSTLFHEMAHSTGHISRMNRAEVVNTSYFGSNDYSKEELVAEFTAYFLCNACGIQNDQLLENTTAYLQSWSKVLKSDPKMAVQCAGIAQKVSDYILGITNTEENKVTVEE